MRIFISYRRDDSKHIAARLADALTREPGIKSVFLDIEDIAAGETFPDRLNSALQGADVCLVLIGRQWLGETVSAGTYRIQDPHDFVRLEVASALSQNKRVIPVCVDDASLPAADLLPEPIRPLLERNALFLRHHSFKQDVEFLIDAIFGRKAGASQRRHPLATAARRASGGVALGLVLFLLVAIANRGISGRNLESSLGGVPMMVVVGILCIAVGCAISFGAVRRLRGR